MAVAMEQASGDRYEFTGAGSGRQGSPTEEITTSFTLQPGAMAIQFEHTASARQHGRVWPSSLGEGQTRDV